MSKLLSPLSIGKTTFKNRIVISPMCQYSSEDGFASDWHLVHLGSRAVGGAALIIQEATAVSPEGRITYADMGLWKDEQMEKLKQIVSFIHAQGALAGIQLAHAGRKASHHKPWDGGKQISSHRRPGLERGIGKCPCVQGRHRSTGSTGQSRHTKSDRRFCCRSKTGNREIGYDVIELHAAHGYLFHQFYSPLSNQRKDEYGGSFDNRVRLLLEVTDAVKQVWGNDKPLFVRLSATDWTDDGWTIEDSIQLSSLLKAKGVDLIDTSSGGNAVAHIPLKPGYQVDFAAQIKQGSGILTGAVGLITTAEQANNILEKEEADLILIARESLRDPYFPLHAAQTLGDDYQYPVQYERAKPR